MGASTGMFGAAWAQAKLRKLLGASGAKVLDTERPVGHAQEAFDEDGNLVERDAAERLREIIAELVAQAEQLEMGRSDRFRREEADPRGG